MGIRSRLKDFFSRHERKRRHEKKRSIPHDKISVPRRSEAVPRRKAREIRHLTLGLDWGTSCTKAVVRDRYGADEPTFVIDFGNLGLNSETFLLPSVCYVRSDGTVSLERAGEGQVSLKGMKLAILGQPWHYSDICWVEEASVAFLASALKLSKTIFERHWGRRYKRFDIEWEVNIGVPAAHLDDSDLIRTYQEICNSAWSLSEKSELTLNDCRQMLRNKVEGSTAKVTVVPEVIAQVMGYAKSTERREGLHFIVDVGAATLDIAGFSFIVEDGDDYYTFWNTNVELLGVEMSHRLSDVVQPSFRALHRVFHEVRKNMNPSAPEWKTGCVIFVCGGGRDVDPYQRALSKLNNWWQEWAKVAPFSMRYVPLPDSIQSNGSELEHQNFHRVSVAFGLSFPSIEHGNFRTPGEISPIKRPPPPDRGYANEDTAELN